MTTRRPHGRSGVDRRRRSEKSPRSGRARQAVALVPLTLLSAAWTVNLTHGAPGDAPEAAEAQLPDGSAVPAAPIEDPASYSLQGRTSRGLQPARAQRMVSTASVNGIPTAALGAYQRAATVLNAADGACHLDWQLVAAIGKVESNHGRFGGSALGRDGVVHPGIYGVPLNGRNSTALIHDTDAGLFDRDETYDRAVGPMQFIPSTWNAVGVDADGDGRRDPQDIDDAALAGAVYLCSGDQDLGTDAGRRAAVFRYNRSQTYVDLVLAIMDSYLEGEYVSVPSNVAAAVVVTSAHGAAVTSPKPGKAQGQGASHADDLPSSGPTPAPSPAPEPSPTPSPDPEPGQPVPAKQIAEAVEQTTQQLSTGADKVLTLAQATLVCIGKGYTALLTPGAWAACVDELTRREEPS